MWRGFTTQDRNRRYRIGALAVLGLALSVRLWGIQYGLPYSYYPDEAHFLNRSLSFGTGDLNPHWFHKPAFYMYLLFCEYGVFYGLGRLAGVWSSVTDFAVSYIRDPGAFYLIGRLTTMAFGLGCIWGAYRIGARYFSRPAGLIAALLLTLTQGHVATSQVIKADMPTACFGIWSMYFLLAYLQEKSRRSLIFSCVLAGVGAATKYYTILLLVPVCVAIVSVRHEVKQAAGQRWAQRAICLLVALTAFWGSYFVGSPYNFLDARGRHATFKPVRVVVDRGREWMTGNQKERPIDFIARRRGVGGGASDYAAVLFSDRGMGVVIATLGLIGSGVMLIRWSATNATFLIFPMLFAAGSVVSYPGYPEARHQIPLYPFLAVAGGLAVTVLARRLGRWGGMAYGALMLALCWPGWVVISRGSELSVPETRNTAKAWIEANIPAGTKLLVDENGPPLLMCPAQLDTLIQKTQERRKPDGQFTAHYATFLEYQKLAARQSVTYELLEIRLPWWRDKFLQEGHHALDSDYDSDMANPIKPVGVHTYDDYAEMGFQYVIVHGEAYEKFFLTNRTREKFPLYHRFYHELFDRGTLVKRFSPGDDGLRGPEVRIYQMVNESRSRVVPEEKSGQRS